MAKDKKNTSNSNTNKGLKYSTKNRLILGTFITVLVLTVVGYFIYISGFLAKVIPAVKVEQTLNGQTKTIATINTLELNYYRNQIMSMYSMYGQQMDNEFLDQFNAEKGKTNRELIYDSAAESAMNVYLVNDYAKKDPSFVSGADRYADYDLYMFSLRAKNNNYPTTDQYLAIIYGTGMSSTQYKEIVAREELTQEYEQYVRQFKFKPSKEELQAMYDADPDQFQRASFNTFFFNGATYPDGQALEMANNVAAAAKDSDSFNEALIAELGEEYAANIGLTVESNNSLVSNATKAMTDGDNYPDGVTEFVFNNGNIGTAKVFETETGAVVVFLTDVFVNDENTYSYRQIVINNEAYEKLEDGEVPAEATVTKGLSAAQKEAEDIKASITDELSFANAVKKNTDAYQEITTAGYNSSITAASVATNENSPAEDVAFENWLLAPERQHGDMIVITSADNRTVTIYYFSDVVPAWMNTLALQEITTKVNDWSTNELNTQSSIPYVSYSVANNLSYYAS